MSKDTILRGLRLLWEKLQLLFERAWDAPQILRAWSEGRASLGDKIALVAMLVLLVAAVAWVVRFFKAGFFKKLGMLASLALVMAAAALVLWFLDTGEESAAPTPPPVIQTDGGEAAVSAAPTALLPEATPRPARRAGQYSLARGTEDPFSDHVSYMWSLRDDAVVWQMDDDLVLELSGLHSLPGGPFAVEELVRYEDKAHLTLRRVSGSGTESARSYEELVLELTVSPDAKIRRQLWYAEAASYVSTGEQEGYSILRNDGSEVLFLQRSLDRTNENGDAVLGLCLGRQLGDDVVLVTARSYAYDEEEGHRTYTNLNPGEDEELKERLLSLDKAVFDGRLRLVRGLSEHALAALLPGSLCDLPLRDASGVGGFSLPCTRLLELRRSEAYGAILRFTAEGPDGGEAVYSLISGAALYTDVRMDRYFTWREAYEKNGAEPDPDMSAFVGCPAVAADGGWIIDVGGFYNASLDATLENYYFLSYEYLTPPPTPTPEPTPESAEEAETPDAQQEETHG